MARMNDNGFLFDVGQDLHLFPDKRETEEHYAERVILSAGAKWMLTAVYDEEEKVSIDSMKSAVQEKIGNYLEIVHHQSVPDIQILVNIMYNVLLSNGMFYHEPYHLRPVPNREIGIGDISIIRGLFPEENARFSGMAPYIPGGGKASLADEFMLWKQNGTDTLRSAWQHSIPQEAQTTIGEYLRVDYRMYQKYYDVKRHDQAEFTLGRTRKNDAYGFDYYMIHGDEIRRMTDDYINASVHAYVTLAIVNGQKKQKVLAKIGDHLAELEIGYLLPKPDARFLQFVSWPESLQNMANSGFRVSLHPRIWPMVKDRLIFLGFAVEEQYE